MILIVDDVPEIVEWLMETVRDAGYFADYSMDSASALYKLQRIHYSMALIDIRLVGLDGNDLARKVKMMPDPFCDVPLVAMTGSRMTADESLFVSALQKPFFPNDLREVITKYARPPIEALHTPQSQGASP